MGQRDDKYLKSQAIELVLLGQKTTVQIARDLDIKPNTLYSWVDHYRGIAWI